ncbi:MAG: KUP/HAK/KT family potassium transporter [Steroidobacteraceae bacterium]
MDNSTDSGRLALTIGALGIVFGDIGTSPLYALRACFTNVAGMAVNQGNVLGILSLIFWSLALVISIKYVSIVLRADNEGEGGVLALTGLVLSQPQRRGAPAIAALGLLGCALFYGDGVITPAVTVLGSIEGLEVIEPAMERVVLPITIAVLLWLFALQRRGTGAIGRLFGPMMVVWFVSLAVLGLRSIWQQPEVLLALNPAYAVQFFAAHAGAAFAVFGAVFLAVTGGEALYADLGHFGRQPITIAWFSLAWPCLLLNYFGQGALLLTHPAAIDNPFYLLAPSSLLLPLLLLATAASIIASQAVISGVFTISQQCQQLGYLPRMQIRHFSAAAIGQVYVPVINWLLCVVTILLAVGFGTSNAIANAYGVGVSCTMLIDTALMLVLLAGATSLSQRTQFGLLCAIGLVDVAFVLANLGKIPSGGWFPVIFGASTFMLMRTWQAGRAIVTDRVRREDRTVKWFLDYLAKRPPVRVPGVAVFLTSNRTGIPRTLVRNIKMNGVLHEQTLLLTMITERSPKVARGGRFLVEDIAPGIRRVVVRSGFMEVPDVPKLLHEASQLVRDLRTDQAQYFLGRDDIVMGAARTMSSARKRLFLFLARNSLFAAASFGIPPNRVMEVGGQIEI